MASWNPFDPAVLGDVTASATATLAAVSAIAVSAVPSATYSYAWSSAYAAPSAVYNAAASVASSTAGQTVLSTGPDDWFAYYGPLEIGVLIGQFFYGAFVICACMYYARCHTDNFLNKSVIGVLLITTTVETLIGCIQVIEYTAEHPTDINFLLTVSNRGVSWIRPVLYSITALVSQVFLTFRVILFARSLRKSNEMRVRRFVFTLLGGLCLAVIGAWGLSFGALATVGTVSNLQNLVDPASGSGMLYRFLTGTGMALVTLVNVLLTILLTTEARFTRSSTGPRRFLDTIVSFTVRNGLLVTLVQAAQLALTFALPAWGAGFTPLFIGKIYALTILCILAQSEPLNRPTSRLSRYANDCGTHALAIQHGLPKCPACGTALPRLKEMILIGGNGSQSTLNMSMVPGATGHSGVSGVGTATTPRGSVMMSRAPSDDGVSELKIRVQHSPIGSPAASPIEADVTQIGSRHA